MELKSIATEFKLTAKREIEGHAAVFGNKDSYGDVIQPGAFARTLTNDRGRMKVLWQHDPSNPLGKPLEMREDEKGLFVKARIADTVQGRDALALFDAEVIDELSIGYDSIVEEYDNEKGVRYLREIKLWEFSPVTWAANELAKITSVKHASDLDAVLDRLQRVTWVKGRLESPRLREKAEAAVLHLAKLLTGEEVHNVVPTSMKTDFDDAAHLTLKTLDPIPSVAAPSGTPLQADPAPDSVHAAVGSLSALNAKLNAAVVSRELRAFSEKLRSN